MKQQRDMVKALPAHRLSDVKKHCNHCSMKGDGIMDIIKSVGRVLGPIAKEIGPTILKELVMPFIKKKVSGKGLHVSGGALRLAGQGAKRKKNVRKLI